MLEADEIILTDTEPVDGTYRRTRWRATALGFLRVEEWEREPEGPWQASWDERLESSVCDSPPTGE